MNVVQSFFIALEMLRLHKLRAFLTMLGVIIGVMSVTIIVMVSNGFQSYLDNEFKKLGADTIILAYDPGRQDRNGMGFVDGLKMEDLEFLRDRVSSMDIASATMQVPASEAKFGDHSIKNPTVFAVDEYFSELNRMGVIAGRHFIKADIDSKANICVVGGEVVDALFPTVGAPPPKAEEKAAMLEKAKSIIGRQINLPGITLQIVGVLERMDIMGSSSGKSILVPITTAQSKWLGNTRINFITLRPKKGIKVDRTMDDVWQAMMVRSGNRPVYRVDSRESIMKVFGGVIGVAGVILAAIAALSLLVGGIGIMNIMLVSVTERTREIGLRKAVGARSAAILTQFMVEAATLGLVGGLIGMFIAWSLGNIVTLLTAAREWPSPGGLATPFPLTAALMAGAFSAFIGMVFGLYPAVSASKLDPIVALRHE